MREPKLGDILRSADGTEFMVHFVGAGQVYVREHPEDPECQQMLCMSMHSFMDQASQPGVEWV